MTDVPSWINRGQPDRPEWLKPHLIGKAEPNGSFMIKTKLGQARVHLKAIVMEWDGHAHTCEPAEARQLLADLKAEAAAPPPRDTPGSASLGAAEVADRTDDTDDITRRIRGSEGPAPVPATKPATRSRATSAKASPPPSRSFPPAKGMPPSIENRNPGELEVDDSYQRSIDTGPSRALIKRIANNWDWRKCLPLVVSKRDSGELYVIDGQHRLEAAKMRGDIQFLPCCVAIYASVADEAAMFVEMNRERRPINRLDDFHAALAGADPEAIATADLIGSVGFTVSRRTGSASWAPGEVAFTTAIGNVRRRHGEDLAREALALMAEAFAGQRLSAGSSVFTATAAALVSPPPEYDRERMIKALGLFDMAGWSSFLTQTTGGSDRHAALRTMLLAAYADIPLLRDESTAPQLSGASHD